MVFQNGTNWKHICVTNYPQVAPANSNITRQVKAKPKFKDEKQRRGLNYPRACADLMAETMLGCKGVLLRHSAMWSTVIPCKWSSSMILSWIKFRTRKWEWRVSIAGFMHLYYYTMREVQGMVWRSWLNRWVRPNSVMIHLSLSSSIMVRSKSKTTVAATLPSILAMLNLPLIEKVEGNNVNKYPKKRVGIFFSKNKKQILKQTQRHFVYSTSLCDQSNLDLLVLNFDLISTF